MVENAVQMAVEQTLANRDMTLLNDAQNAMDDTDEKRFCGELGTDDIGNDIDEDQEQ